MDIPTTIDKLTAALQREETGRWSIKPATPYDSVVLDITQAHELSLGSLRREHSVSIKAKINYWILDDLSDSDVTRLHRMAARDLVLGLYGDVITRAEQALFNLMQGNLNETAALIKSILALREDL